jgi:3-oxoadipate enol-lactonase
MQSMGADGQVAVTASGEGPPLVLLHSLLADASSFDRVVPALARDFRLLVPDLPGFGGSAPAPGGLEAVADRVAQGVREAAAALHLGLFGVLAAALTDSEFLPDRPRLRRR